ncbi:MAG TPA: LuxR C-terminal-related transcriptional regulator [Buttiauxella sp.]|jgi:two-component system secretion response regulator SsrB
MLTYNLTGNQFDRTNTVSRILVIDKSTIIAFAIKKLLIQYPYMDVVAHCQDRYNIMPALKKNNPSMVIIDPDLPCHDGLKIIKQLQRHKPDLQFIVYTHDHIAMNLDELIRLKVQGITLKGSKVNNLLTAINTVCRGFTYMDQELTPNSSTKDDLAVMTNLSDTLALPRISPREKQILGLISQGLKSKEIAEKLTISIKTVESHRLNMMRKLDAHSIVDLMKWAIRLNIA